MAGARRRAATNSIVGRNSWRNEIINEVLKARRFFVGRAGINEACEKRHAWYRVLVETQSCAK